MNSPLSNAQHDGVARLPAGLYVLATPLGNLGDITLRALDTLKRADTIACEDTRVTRDLLRLLSIDAPRLISVREHNERAQADAVIARIAANEAVVYASDAGTPAISDPGARLVAAVRAAGCLVVPIPGVSAVTTALSVCGFDATQFSFFGFAPTTASALDELIDSIGRSPAISVCFESPHRVQATLSRFAERLPAERQVVIARELTKKFETVACVNAAMIPEWLRTHESTLRGEFVLVVDAASDARAETPQSIETRALLRALLAELPASKAAKVAAQLTGESRQTLYELAGQIKGAREDGGAP